MPTLDEAILGGATRDPLDAAIDTGNDKRRQSLIGGVRQNPDEYGRAVQLSRTTGVPAPVVARNLPDVEQRTKIDALDAAIVRGSAVDRSMQNPDFASLAHDDVPNANEIEAVFNPRMSAGRIGGPAFRRETDFIRPSTGPEASFSTVVSGLFKSLGQGGELARQGLRAQFADVFGLQDMSADAIRRGQQAQFDVSLSTPNFESSTAAGAYAGGSSLLRQLPGLGLSVATRSAAPALATMGVQTEAEAYGKYRGRGATPGQAFAGAAGEGATEVATEMLPMGFLVSRLGKAGAGEFLTGLLAREIPSEQVATLVQDAIDTAVANPDKTWGDYAKERPDAAYQTLVATITQAGAMGAINEVARRTAGPQAQADQAAQDAEALRALSALAAASKVRPRDVQSFEQFVEAANADGPVQELYLDTRALQQAGIDPAALAALSPTAAAQMQEAIATGADLVIPVSEYAGRIAGSELDSVLLQHLRTSEDALSVAEAQQFQQEQARMYQEQAAKVMEEKAADDAFQASAKAVETKLFDELKNTGRFTDDVNTAYSTLMRDFYVTTASRLGITPEEMFSRYPLQVRAESVVADARMDQADSRRFVLNGVEYYTTQSGMKFKGNTPLTDAEYGAAFERAQSEGESTEARLSYPPGGVEILYRGEGGDSGGGNYFTGDKEFARNFTGSGRDSEIRRVGVATDDIYTRQELPFAGNEASIDAAIEEAKAAGKKAIRVSEGKEQPPSVFVFDKSAIKRRVANAKQTGYNQGQGAQDDNDLDFTGSGTRTDRPGVQADQEPRTVGGSAPRDGWAAATRVKRTDGKPAVVYRGAGRPLAGADFERSALGAATGNPSSGLGVWFTPDREEAGRYGEVESFQLDLRKPKVIRIEDLPGFDTVDDANAFARELAAQGYDGIAVDARHLGGPVHFVAFDPNNVIVPPAPRPLDMGQFFQSERIGGPLARLADLVRGKSFETAKRAIVAQVGSAGSREKFDDDVADSVFLRLQRVAQVGRYTDMADLAYRNARRLEGDGDITIYRAAPKGAGIRPGDFAAGSAQEAGFYKHGGNTIQKAAVPRRDVIAVDGSSGGGQEYVYLPEGYAPPEPQEWFKSFREFFDAVNSTDTLNQPQQPQGGNRGEISFSRDITESPSVITLFQRADLSTFLHEMGHFQLEVLANIASRPDAPQGIVDDMNAALKWFGIKGDESVQGGEQSGELAQGAVETEAFKRWFGDSKVVDADGKPLVVYHGTGRKFNEFTPLWKQHLSMPWMDIKEGGRDYAYHMKAKAEPEMHFFSEDEALAQSYADQFEDGRVVPVYLRVSNPVESADRDTALDEMLASSDADGAAFYDTNARGLGRARSWVVRGPTQIKSAIGNRGTFDPNDPNILRQGGDEGVKPDSLPAGRTPLDVWNAMSLEEKRPYHEQFARGFEAYLFEGKAPSQELQSLFQRFRAWLLSVYKSIKTLNVEISDDIRGVFDRLLATEETIKAAEAARSYTPLFKTPEEAGLPPQEWADYERLGIESTRDAQDELQRRSLKDMQWLTNARSRVLKQLQRDAKEKRKAVEDEVRAEVKATPVYAAMHFLKRGEMTAPDGEQIKVEKGHKFDSAALAEMYPETMLARPNLDALRGMTRKDGLPPDLIAEMFGYTSGDQLVREIINAEPEAQLVEGLTDQRVLERYGDLANPDTLARAADEAIHNEARARFVATEVKALTKATGPVRAMTKAAKQFAETMVARKKVKDIKPRQFSAAETRAAKNAERALAAGDTATAAAEKRSQLVQNYATRAAYDAVDEIEKGVRYLRKFDSEGTRKNIDTEYTDQIDTLLERFDLRSSVTNKEAAKRVSLIAWVESQREQGLEPDIPPELLDTAQRKPYREMTLEEFRGLVDTVKQIEHLGRLKQKLLTAKDEREFAAATAEIAASIDENANGRTAETRTPTDPLGKLAKSLRRFWASHIKAATWSRVLDGGKDGGPMWEYFIRSANEKGDMETEMRAEATKALSAILGPVVKQWPRMQMKGQYFESVGRAFTREGAMALALNTGNAGNLQRLLGGEGWALEQIRPVLESLTAQEWQAVQAVWDHFDSYKTEIGAKERRIYGKEPNWVEPTPFTVRTADGQEVNLKGGYYPIKYDPAASQRAEEHADAEQAQRDMRGAYTAATTRRSFTKARAEEVTGRPLLYSLVGVYSGVNDVIHDLAWHEWLIDANRLLRAKNVDQAIRSQYGPEVKDQFKQWVKDVAQGETRADHPAEQSVAWLRQSVSAAGLGFNVMSAIMQVTGFSSSVVRVGPSYIARGVAQYVASPIATTREVIGKSSFMAGRSRTQFRELNELRNQVEGQTAAGRVMTLGTYFLMMRAQRMVDVPTWLGAYEKAIAEGNNEERSIALADQAVIDSQGSGMVKDLSTVERGGQALKLFTVFYSYMNTTLNVGVQAAMTERNKAKLAAKMLMTFTVPAVLGAAIKSAFTPGGDDEPEDILRKLLAEQISFLTGLMVGVREFSEVGKIMAGAEGARDYSGPAGVRVVGDAIKFGQQAKQGEFDSAFRRSSINLLGDLTGLPAAQINRTLNGIEALDEGDTDNPAAVVLGYER